MAEVGVCQEVFGSSLGQRHHILTVKRQFRRGGSLPWSRSPFRAVYLKGTLVLILRGRSVVKRIMPLLHCSGMHSNLTVDWKKLGCVLVTIPSFF